MNPILLTVLSAFAFFATLVIIFGSKLIMGANAEKIAEGKPTKSRDELRREIWIVRVVMYVLIFACVIAGAIIVIIR